MDDVLRAGMQTFRIGGQETGGTAVDRGILNTLTGESVTGNPYSQLRLGWLYDLGWGVEHSPYKAITWYTGAKIMGLRMADALIARVNYGLSRPGT